jgi:hypothetical protein
MPIVPLFTELDADAAHEEWGCNCGPTALAAIMRMTLDDVRPHLGDFEKRRYLNPTMMQQALVRIGARFRVVELPPRDRGLAFPAYGLARIQFDGPWMSKGANPKWRYMHTHWVGAERSSASVHIFDVNALENGTGWTSLYDWSSRVAPQLIASHERATGSWHVTDRIEIERVAEAA